jgi:hypothetical protein
MGFCPSSRIVKSAKALNYRNSKLILLIFSRSAEIAARIKIAVIFLKTAQKILLTNL